MVSILCRVAVISLAATVWASAQEVAPAGFRPESRSNPAPAQTPAASPVTPEVRADIYMARKMFREAAETYKEGPQNSPVILNKTGIAYHQMLDLDTAKKYYERAIRLNPKYAEAINNLGTIYYSHKSYRRAITYYKRALRLDPNSPAFYSNLGSGYFARKDYKNAADCWQKALELDPEIFEHKGTHGVVLQERSTDDRAKFHYYLAKTYARAGQNERALMYIRKSLEEGFKERKKFEEEPEFAALRDLPEFKQLLALEPRVL